MTRRKDKKKGEPMQGTSIVSEQTDEEILAAGESAARLLNEPIYQEAYEGLIQDYQDQWMMTLPHESQKREHLYNKVQAASDHAKELAARVQATQGINLDQMKKTQVNPTFQ